LGALLLRRGERRGGEERGREEREGEEREGRGGKRGEGRGGEGKERAMSPPPLFGRSLRLWQRDVRRRSLRTYTYDVVGHDGYAFTRTLRW